MTANNDPTSEGALILAAGEASRMGRLKQLLPFAGQSMLTHAVAQAQVAGFAPICVVTGAFAASVSQMLALLPVLIAENQDWALGMGTSIRTGVQCLLTAAPLLESAAVLLADQPFVSASHLQGMRAALAQQPEAGAVAAFYNGTLGAPALFRRSLFPQLLALPSHSGAGALLRSGKNRAISFPLPEAAFDIDTPADYAQIQSSPPNL